MKPDLIQAPLPKSSLTELIRLAGEFVPVPPGLTLNKIIQAPDGSLVKVRAYATPAEAETIALWLERLAGKISYPQLLGQWGQYLVFRYLDVEPMDKNQTGTSNPHYLMGQFLAIINQEGNTGVTIAEFQEEFSRWLKRFVRLRMLPQEIGNKALAWYAANLPTDVRVCLDYWDAMLHNFGVHAGQLYLLDEKHLRPSFPYIGLVKPFLLLPSHQWEAVRQGYQSRAPLDFFDNFQPFFEIYYLFAALYFYSLSGAAGRLRLGRNPRFLDYRQRIITRVAPAEPGLQRRALFDLFRAFPQDSLFLFRWLLNGAKYPTSVASTPT